MKYPVFPIFYEEVSKKHPQDSEFAENRKCSIQCRYVMPATWLVLVAVLSWVVNHVSLELLLPQHYMLIRSWSPAAEVVSVLLLVLELLVARIHFKLMDRSDVIMKHIRRSKYFLGENDDVMLVALPDHFQHGHVQADEVEQSLGMDERLQKYVEALENGPSCFPADALAYKQMQQKLQTCPEALRPLFAVAWQEILLFQKRKDNQKLFMQYGMERYVPVAKRIGFQGFSQKGC